jgi:hypothetical protein
MSKYKDKKVIIVGAQNSGLSLAKFFHQQGAKITISDVKTREQLGSVADQLEEFEPVWDLGGHSPKAFAGQDLIVLSPGVSRKYFQEVFIGGRSPEFLKQGDFAPRIFAKKARQSASGKIGSPGVNDRESRNSPPQGSGQMGLQPTDQQLTPPLKGRGRSDVGRRHPQAQGTPVPLPLNGRLRPHSHPNVPGVTVKEGGETS